MEPQPNARIVSKIVFNVNLNQFLSVTQKLRPLKLYQLMLERTGILVGFGDKSEPGGQENRGDSLVLRWKSLVMEIMVCARSF